MVALCAGPARAAQTIREALAKGADRAIHIEAEDPARCDPLAAARLLAAAIAPEKPDLVLTGLQSRRSGLRADRRDSGGAAGPAARHHHHGGGEARGRHPREARAGGRLVPARGDAAAGAADHSIRHQQAALRHPDGHQESQDQGGPAPDARRNWAARRPRPASRWIASTCPSAPSRRRCSTATPGKPPPNWWRN